MDIEANTIIGAFLRSARRREQLTQSDLATLLNKPQSYVSKIESGERSLHVSELFDYSNALNVPPEDLVAAMRGHLDK